MHDNGNLLNLSLGTALLLAVVVVAHIFLIRQDDTAFLIPNFVLFFFLSFFLSHLRALLALWWSQVSILFGCPCTRSSG